jgi:two-component system chemotaxis sensor kinase CheA
MNMNVDESMLDVFIYENQQLLESLENVLLEGEKEKKLTQNQINEVFRVMHTIKGASSMMGFDKMALLSHAIEDLFAQIREFGAPDSDWPEIFDMVFRAISFFNGELDKLLSKKDADGDPGDMINQFHRELEKVKEDTGNEKGKDSKPVVSAPKAVAVAPVVTMPVEHGGDASPYYKLKLRFTEDSRMENIRALGVVQSLKSVCERISTIPADLADSDSTQQIADVGLVAYLQTKENPDVLKKMVDETLFLLNYSLLSVAGDDEEVPEDIRLESSEDAVHAVSTEHEVQAATGQKSDESENKSPAAEVAAAAASAAAKQNFISVNVNKLDDLLNLVGEIVTAQSMVTNSATIVGIQNDSFDVAAQQLRSLINDLQEIVMSIRMLPVSTVFHKMRRLVRDMGKKVNKDVDFVMIGEETEVDKNVIDHLSDPLMHIIRNSMDHGIEDKETRAKTGKPACGKITLSAQTTGNDVVVTVSDDGKGLDRKTILRKAYEKGLINKPENEITDKEVYALIFLPGFSTKEEVSEFSGRGVGMDVVRKNIAQIGGTLSVESTPGQGTSHIIRIPLTLTIVDGMRFNVGNINFIVPTISVRSAVKPSLEDIFTDSDNNEMIMYQGNCYSLLRLSEYFHIEEGVKDLQDGMIMLVTSGGKDFCIFFDNLDGEYQVVVKTLPKYLEQCTTNLEGISGCSILGDGTINLILEVGRLIEQ